jgi:hypothetical protein
VKTANMELHNLNSSLNITGMNKTQKDEVREECVEYVREQKRGFKLPINYLII